VPTVLNLASESVVNYEYLHPRVWAATTLQGMISSFFAEDKALCSQESQDGNLGISQNQANTAVTIIDGID